VGRNATARDAMRFACGSLMAQPSAPLRDTRGERGRRKPTAVGRNGPGFRAGVRESACLRGSRSRPVALVASRGGVRRRRWSRSGLVRALPRLRVGLHPQQGSARVASWWLWVSRRGPRGRLPAFGEGIGVLDPVRGVGVRRAGRGAGSFLVRAAGHSRVGSEALVVGGLRARCASLVLVERAVGGPVAGRSPSCVRGPEEGRQGRRVVDGCSARGALERPDM